MLVLDLTEEGDVTKRFLGGVDAAGEKVDELFGSVFKLFSDAQRRGGGAGLMAWLWDADLWLSCLRAKTMTLKANCVPCGELGFA